MVPIRSSDGGSLPIVDKTLKRKLSNRESARKSRMKKQEKLQDLTNEIGQLQKEIEQRKVSVDASQKKCNDVEAKNKVLMAQKVELERRLESLDSILVSKKRQEASDYSMCIAGLSSVDDLNLLDVMDFPEITGGFELASGDGFGYSVESSPEIPDHMVNPWQLPSMDYPGMFQC